MSDEAFEKIEDAFKLGRGWFDAMVQTPAQPPSPAQLPNLADTLAQLGRVIAASDELTRDQLKPLFTRMLDEPQRAPEIIKRIESTITSSSDSAPTTDVGHKEKPGFLK